jgi:hypothetical protein
LLSFSAYSGLVFWTGRNEKLAQNVSTSPDEDKELYLMIKEGDFVIRTAGTAWKTEGFL